MNKISASSGFVRQEAFSFDCLRDARLCAARSLPYGSAPLKSMGHPIADERLKGQRRCAALCVLVHDNEVVVVGRIINDGKGDDRGAMG